MKSLNGAVKIGALSLLGLGPVAAQPVPETIDLALDASATIRPYRWGILMESEDGGTEYYSRNPDTGMIPASNTKIFTTAAAVGLLGEDYQFRTRVFRSAGTASNGVFTGTIYVLGEHDTTWHTDVFGSGQANRALRTIAQRTVAALAAQGITQVDGRVEGRGAMLYNKGATDTGHQSLSTASVSEQNRQVAVEFRTQLIAAGLTFTSVINSTGATGFTPDASWPLLTTYLSGQSNDAFTGRPLTLVEACGGVNKPSHNPMADLLLRHLGYVRGGSDTYTAGATQLRDWLTTNAITTTTGIVMTDGSGISGSNRFTARQTVDLLRYMAAESPAWEESLPISCTDGTLGSRLCGTLAGRVFAKTGTLPSTGAVGLSGFLIHPTDQQRYYFSIYVNTPGATSGGQAIDTTLGRNAIDAAVRGLGDRALSIAPDLLVARAAGPTQVELQWADPGHVISGFRVSQTHSGGTVITNVGASYIIEPGRSDVTIGLNRGDYSFVGTPESSSSHSTAPGLTAGAGSQFFRPTAGPATAIFTPSALPAGRYRVDVTCFDFVTANATNITATIVDRQGTRSTRMALTEQTAGNTWRSVGTIDFVPGQNHRVTFGNSTQTTTGTDDRMNPAAVRFVPLFTSVPALAGAARDYSLSTVGSRALASYPSDVYTVVPGLSPRVLMVDGYDRWNIQTQNAFARNHAFVATTARPITGRAIDSVANEALTEGRVALGNYDAAVWVLGEESTTEETFSAAEQALVSAFQSAGGGLLVSGSEIGWDLDRVSGPTTADRQFIKNTLRAEYSDARSDTLNDSAGTGSVTGAAAPFVGIGLSFSNTAANGPYPADFPDVLVPVGAGARIAMTYSGGTGNGLGAAIAYDGSAGGGRVITMGFPIETILDTTTREAVVRSAIDFIAPADSVGDSNGWMFY